MHKKQVFQWYYVSYGFNHQCLYTISSISIAKPFWLNIHYYVLFKSFRFFWRDSYTEADAAGDAIHFIYDLDVDVIFGSPHSLCRFSTLLTYVFICLYNLYDILTHDFQSSVYRD